MPLCASSTRLSPGAPPRFLHVGSRTRNAKTPTAICFPRCYATGHSAEGPKSSLGGVVLSEVAYADLLPFVLDIVFLVIGAGLFSSKSLGHPVGKLN